MKKDNSYTINGITKKLSQWCQEYNVDFQLVYNRMRNGRVSELETYLKKPRKRKRKKYYHNGEFKSASQIAREEGISAGPFLKRIEKYGYNEALKKDFKPKKYLHRGKRKTIRQLSLESGIAYATLYSRIKNGWEINEALKKPTDEQIYIEEGLNCRRYNNTPYFIFRDGRVYNIETKKFLTPSGEYTSGLLVVNLSSGGKTRSHSLKKLVAELFIDNPKNHKSIGHKDGNLNNCHANNLYWGTSEEISKNSFAKNNPILMLSKRSGTLIRTFESYEQAAQYFNIGISTIKKYIREKKVVNEKFVLVRKKKMNKYILDYYK